MLLPIGDSISVPVEIVCPTAVPPLSISGELVVFSGTHCRVRTESHRSQIADCARLVVSIDGPRGLRFLCTVDKTQANTIELQIQRIVHKDKRDFPRVSAAVSLRYHLLDAEPSSVHRAWQKGIEEVSHVLEWHSPNKFINFSRSGLQFTDSRNCIEGDQLMIELQFAGSSIIHRLLGRVVRVEALSEDRCTRNFDAVPAHGEHPRGQDTHSVAINFDRISNRVEEALSRATVRQQMKEIEWKQSDSLKTGA